MNLHTIVLASSSPRRQQFLSEIGLLHRIQPADIDETPHREELGGELAQRLALAKAEAVADQIPAAWLPAVVIGSDTVVVADVSGREGEGRPDRRDETILGKPATPEEAIGMLALLRETGHRVLSAVALVRIDQHGSQAKQVRLNATRVTMRGYTDAEIRAYVDSGDCMDKAGAYAIQHRTFSPVERLAGCPAGVMGLPLADLAEMLANWKIELPDGLSSTCHTLTGLPCCQQPAQTDALFKT